MELGEDYFYFSKDKGNKTAETQLHPVVWHNASSNTQALSLLLGKVKGINLNHF